MRLNELTDIVHAELNKEQRLRSQRAKMVGNELEWVTAERKFMIDLVNRRRVELGKSKLEGNEVETAEHKALGHTDYSLKWSLYCAELILS